MAGELKGILAQVADAEPDIIQQVKDYLVQEAKDKEVDRRIRVIQKACNIFKDMQGRIRNLEVPDMEWYSTPNSLPMAVYSPNRIHHIKAVKTAAEALKSAIDCAIAGDIPALNSLKELCLTAQKAMQIRSKETGDG